MSVCLTLCSFKNNHIGLIWRTSSIQCSIWFICALSHFIFHESFLLLSFWFWRSSHKATIVWDDGWIEMFCYGLLVDCENVEFLMVLLNLRGLCLLSGDELSKLQHRMLELYKYVILTQHFNMCRSLSTCSYMLKNTKIHLIPTFFPHTPLKNQ